jgi:transcriptional regulator with XRE-family HTH domain
MENMNEHLDNAIGENLRRLRLAQGMTLDALGDASGVSRAMISRIERGETSPTAQLLARICAALGTSLSAFFADAEAPASQSGVIRIRAISGGLFHHRQRDRIST